ncbi:MAG: DUF4350 domain-containing protein [Candidatus Methanoperedens sp.]|nr:DUF4350 domain-containing protein [Candidatus Methanoperedens sp.]MCZ7395487.1 DUF4350 domain-containing protein [Candidatus Methanoperedens sp.]
MKKINKKILLLIASILILIGTFRFSESTADFSTYNPDWNGGMQIRILISEHHRVIAMPVRSDLVSFAPGETAFVILGPRGNFSEKDIYTIRKFVEAGGLLLLSDDFGSGNELLNRFTTSVSFSNMLLQDDVSFWKNSTFPVAATSIGNVSNITMNYPTSLVITDKSIEVLASTSRFGRLSENESQRGQPGSYPVIAYFPYGRGKIIAIADPSIFINSMLPMEENKRLLGEFVENRTTVIFDEGGRMPPVSNIDYLIKTDPYAQYLLAGIIVSLAFLYTNRGKIGLFGRDKTNDHGYCELDEENIISDILKRHKWSERKLMLFKNKLKKEK